MAFSRNQEAQF